MSCSSAAGDELDERIRDALRADAATSRYADSLIIGRRGGKVVVRGKVDDIDDTDNIADVISNVSWRARSGRRDGGRCPRRVAALPTGI